MKPQDFHAGIPIYVLMEVMPGPVRFDPMDDGEAWDQVQITKVERGTIIDEATAKPYLDEVAVALEDLRVQETGQERLPLDDDPMIAEHEVGMHKRKRKECRMCNPQTDEDVARLDAYTAAGAAHGDGEGDADTPTRPATKRRSRAKK